MPRVNHPTDDFDEGSLYKMPEDFDQHLQAQQPPFNLQMPPVVPRKVTPTQEAVAPQPMMPPHPDLGRHHHHGSVLSKYYRIPGPHVKLATNGAFLPRNAIQMTQSGDIPVLPMRAADEMLLKSPDALMSGLALERLFESCVPAIKTPRLISTPDIDVLLLAIRVATYGNKMELSVNCPHCNTENAFDCDLPSLLQTMKFTDTDGSVRLSDEVVTYVRPYNLDNATRLALVAFEETRRLQALDNENLDGKQRADEVNTTMERINQENKRVLADCVYKIVVEEGEVSNKQEIYDFITNIPKSWSEKINDKIKKLNDSGIDKKIHADCSSCGKEWHSEVEFDPANFFEKPSSV